MNDPASRTPEGVPHRCATCGQKSKIVLSPAGDACCPNCNCLVWPTGPEEADEQPNAPSSYNRDMKEIRLRPKTSDHDIEFKINRAKEILESSQSVMVVVVFRGREIAHPEKGKLVLAKVLHTLVPKHGSLKIQPELHGRRFICAIAPN